MNKSRIKNFYWNVDDILVELEYTGERDENDLKQLAENHVQRMKQRGNKLETTIKLKLT